jgi:phosphoenolpyruvate carboxykinase (GTP)
MGEYFQHWLDMQRRIEYPPEIFQVNWFRKDRNGNFLWPGYGENMRVLKWIVDRAQGKVGGQETPIGWVPKAGDLDLSGLDIPPEAVNEATSVNLQDWKIELESQEEFFSQFGNKMPTTLLLQRKLLLSLLK